MKYKIVYDRPGRIRVRCGAGVFTTEQGWGIADMIRNGADADNVEVCPVNGSILVNYPNNKRQTVLSILDGIKRTSLPVGKPRGNDTKKQIDDDFITKTVFLVAGHYLKKFLPMPARTSLIFLKALGFWKDGVASLFNMRLDIPVLDAASIGAAMVQKDIKTAGSVMFLLKLSSMLEEYTKKRTTTALTQSLSVNVDSVWVVSNGNEISVPMSEIKKDDVIRIRTGSLIPVDGVVVFGDAMVNEASITGESLPVHKKTGVSVYAGTVAAEGCIDIKVTALPHESRIQQIVGLIENSENLKAGVQSRAEKMADSIVPFSFIGAVATGIITRNINKALSVFMVDYSCGIKLSASISVISAMREAASRKIMVKGGKFLEAFANADTVIFDKTGTLTEACPTVSGIKAFCGYTEEEVLKTAACIEEHFPHSMARAVVRCAEERGLVHEEEHAEVEYVVAHGVVTKLKGERVLIGSAHFVFEDEHTEYTQEQMKAAEDAANGGSALYLAAGGKLAGVIFINDPPRNEAAETISTLRQLGIKNIVMLTGDSDGAAKAVCEKLGIDEYRSQVLPDEKAAIVESYKNSGRTVIMVGDGVNDSPALAAADVSVSMKDSSDIAREVADVTILSSDLRKLAVMRKLSEQLLARINNSYRFVVGFNTALLILGIAGITAPGRAAFLHNASTMGMSASCMRPLIKV